jgi:hypothetical protein
LRAIHRDIGYLAVGFTVIYAVSGLAINHIADWDPNFDVRERVATMTPVAAGISDAEAGAQVAVAAGTPAPQPDEIYRVGDEVRIAYADGTQVTAVGSQVTVQARSPRLFLRVANWLHYNRGKRAWTYAADAFAVMLLYLAISGIFMIKGRLGLRWRGAVMISLGVAVPLTYVVVSGGPEAKGGEPRVAAAPVAPPVAQAPATPGSAGSAGSADAGSAVLTPLAPDD